MLTSKPASMTCSTAIVSPKLSTTVSDTALMIGAATAAAPPVLAITACVTRSRKRMHGRINGEESPHYIVVRSEARVGLLFEPVVQIECAHR